MYELIGLLACPAKSVNVTALHLFSDATNADDIDVEIGGLTD